MNRTIGTRARSGALRPLLVLSLIVATLPAGSPLPAAAQSDISTVAGASGYEISLHGQLASERGTSTRLVGVVYETSGIATLRPADRVPLVASVSALERDGRSRRELASVTAQSDASGRYALEVPIPEGDLPGLAVSIRVGSGTGRTFTWPLAQLPARALTLLTDRERYEPGETVRAWTLARTTRGQAPIAGLRLTVELLDPSMRPVATREADTSAGGTVSAELVIPETSDMGHYLVRVSSADPSVAQVSRTVEVFRRTTERLQATLTLDQELVRPGERLTGRLRVMTPSGNPVRGASVQLFVREGDSPVELVTDETGTAQIDVRAPTYLSGDATVETMTARVVHPAYGAITASAPYTLARTAWLVSATPEAGGLVPEVDSQLWLSVADPRHRPITAGAEIMVRGLGIPGAGQVVRTDEHGIAVATIRLPRGAAARLSGGACSGEEPAATFEVEVRTLPPITATVCARVASEAQLMARARTPLVAAGSRIEVDVARRPAVAGRPVLLEALWGGRPVAFAWIEGNQTSGALTLPAGMTGTVQLRARPQSASDTRRPDTEPGAAGSAPGVVLAVLVRPADAFALEVRPEREVWRVRERAAVTLHGSQTAQRGWAALVARDESQHGGEVDWALHWIAEELREAVASGDARHERLLRSALAAGLSVDRVQQIPPLVTEPWERTRYGTGATSGVLRDPIALREELLRRGLATITATLERAVSDLRADPASRQGLVRQVGARMEWDPGAIAWLVRTGRLSDGQARALGGQPLTIAMLSEADRSFTLENVARRVARQRLVRLMQALVRLTDPDDAAAARASAGDPPDRWLSRLVQLGVVPEEALVDPWGRPYQLRRVATGRRAAVLLSDRAPGWELVSAGPDGAFGSADDVRDPFARAVPRGTPYAVSSGEDRLMEALSRIAPGARVLAAMAQAYARLGLAAEEERRASVVTATTSESTLMPEAPPPPPVTAADSMLRERAGAGAGGGEGYAMAQSAAESRAPRRSARADMDGDGVRDEMDAEPAEPLAGLDGLSDDRTGAMGALIREDFPATLFFVAEVPLDGPDTRIEIPLADALTTYRLEAIAWTESGWIVSARGNVRVDQEAMVDAPVPPVVTLGDVVRLPVRLSNRTDAPLRVRFELATEGEAGVELATAPTLEVPGGDAGETVVVLRGVRAGEGHLVLRASTEDGRALDAVRRPITVVADMRTVRESRQELIEGDGSVHVVVPSDAAARGPGELRLSVAGALFGDPAAWGLESSPEWAAWSLALAGRPIPEPIAANALSWVTHGEYPEEVLRGRDVLTLTACLGALYADARLTDEDAASVMRILASSFEQVDVERGGTFAPYVGYEAAQLLLALAPALRADSRPALHADLQALAERLRRAAGDEGAQATEAPRTWARVAAALVLSRGASDARSEEMLRRLERHVFGVGSISWVEPETDDGAFEPRVGPTALLALAHSGASRPERALPLVRALAQIARGAPRWSPYDRALASAAAALLATGPGSGASARVTVDGRAIETRDEHGVVVGTLEGIGAPGDHLIVVSLPRGAIALASIELRYALPWTTPPARQAPFEVEWSGELGARDTRSAQVLSIHHRGTRVLGHPVVDIEMPAGTELDEPTRDALTALLAAPPQMEGSTLRLRLRPLAPGGWVRLPLRARWSVGGSLRGLGVSVWDDRGPEPIEVREVFVLPSRAVEIADRGAEPEAPDAEASEPPQPPPRPIPLPIVRPLSEVVR